MLRIRKTLLDRMRGLTALETISAVVIVCILLGAMISWYSSFRTRSKIAETKVFLGQIFDAETAYYKNSQVDAFPSLMKSGRMPQNRKTFLPLSPQPTNPQSKSQSGDFQHGDWALLNISHPDPVYFSYSVETKGVGTNAIFYAIARGDLDGDGYYSRYEMVGRVNPNGEILGKDLIYSLDPLE